MAAYCKPTECEIRNDSHLQRFNTDMYTGIFRYLDFLIEVVHATTKYNSVIKYITVEIITHMEEHVNLKHYVIGKRKEIALLYFSQLFD